MRGESHVVFGLAGAVVIDGIFHLSGSPLIPLIGSHAASADLVAQKAVYYGAAAFGALVPDIDNARSTLGQRLGPISKGIQHYIGHRKLFHSLLGLALTGLVVFGAQFGLGALLLHFGLSGAAQKLDVGLPPQQWLNTGLGLAFIGMLVGYFLHLVADSLTTEGVPWLFPWHLYFGFPPERRWRFKTGTWREPATVICVSVLVVIAVWARVLVV